MKKELPNILKVISAVFVIAVVVGFSEYRRYTLEQQLDGKVASSTAALEGKIAVLQTTLTNIENQTTTLDGQVQATQSQASVYAEQAGSISDDVSTLDKLSKTDPQLLEKYSKVYFLNENYVPSSLTNVDTAFLYDKSSGLQFLTQAEPFLEKLLNAAKTAGLSLEVISAYRSFGTQSILKSSYKVTYGVGTANAFSADQGYSEHQLGTAVDFTTPTVADTFNGFDKTPEYQWLVSNAYLYGFILSYPPDNSYYEYEPWHWRFVGVALATRLHTDNQYFYDLDQRTINDYLSVLFD